MDDFSKCMSTSITAIGEVFPRHSAVCDVFVGLTEAPLLSDALKKGDSRKDKTLQRRSFNDVATGCLDGIHI